MFAAFWSIVALILTGVIIWLIFTDDETVKRILKWDDESQAAKAAAAAESAAKAADSDPASTTEGTEVVQEVVDKPVSAAAVAMAAAEKSIEAPLESAAAEVAAAITGESPVVEEAEDETEDAPGEALEGEAAEDRLQGAVETANLMAEEAAALAGGSKIVVPTTDNFPDNLTKLNGIGEVYERRLYAAGIFTWHQIAETPAAKLAEITQATDAANVGDWPGQARRLAADAGRTGIRYSGPMPDKLTAIPGISGAAQQQLREHGIITYHQLSVAPPEKVEAILGDTGKSVDIAAVIAKAKELA